MSAEREELITLNPFEVAFEDRLELSLHGGPILVGPDGPDWGDTAIEAFMAKHHFGSSPVDVDWPNRVIKIPLMIGMSGGFVAAREALAAECERINEEGGWIKRKMKGGDYGPAGKHLYADVVKATLKLSGGTNAAARGFDPEAELELEVLPDWYGDKIEGEVNEFTGDGSFLVETFGTLPGRVESLVVTDKSGNGQLGLAYAFRCRDFSPLESAAWAIEAEDMTPLGDAEAFHPADLSIFPALSGDGAVVAEFGTNWTAFLGTNLLAPKVRSVGAAAAGAGDVVVPLPAEWEQDDIFLMYVETQNEEVSFEAWAEVDGSPVEVAGAPTPTRLTVFWHRAEDDEAAPVITDPGDHVVAAIIAVKGCVKEGDPFAGAPVTEVEATSDTSVSIPGLTIGEDGCLVLAAFATGTDISSSSHATAWDADGLMDVVERIDSWTSQGDGGGLAVVSGTKVKAGGTGAITATCGTANPKAKLTLALQAEDPSIYLTHSGFVEVWARAAYLSGTTPPWLRLLHDVGDAIAPVINDPVQLPEVGAVTPCMVRLGLLNLQRSGFGEHRWQGMFQGRKEPGEDAATGVYIDKLYFRSVTEGSGILKGAISPIVNLDGFEAKDTFHLGGGFLDESPLPDGSGDWSTGGGETDFQYSGSDSVTRKTKEDTEARHAVAPGEPLFEWAHRLTFEYSALPVGEPSKHLATELRLESTAGLTVITTGSESGPATTLIGGKEYPLLAGTKYTLAFMVIGTAAGSSIGFGWITEGDKDPEGEPDFIIPTNSSIGRPVFTDFYDGKTAITRNYSNFAAWIPAPDLVAFANRAVLLSSRGCYRQSPDGLASGPVAWPGADLPRIPVSGREGRPVEIALKLSRGDFENVPDLDFDAFQAQLTYRPCWSAVPEA